MAMNRERVVFEVFINVYPDFAGEPIKEWYVLDDWYAATETREGARFSTGLPFTQFSRVRR